MNECPSFYSTIPAPVRYDHSLSDFEKVLYGEIACLTTHSGFCWASDLYFMSMFNKSKATIQRNLRSLEDAGYIKIKTKSAPKGGSRRHIRMTHKGNSKIKFRSLKNETSPKSQK